jgi:hypothetical protein
MCTKLRGAALAALSRYAGVVALVS